MSIDSDSVTVPPVLLRADVPRFGGDFSGDEKIPDTGSIPYSSRTPLSSSLIPVFLPPLVSIGMPMLWSVARPTSLVRRHCRIDSRDFRVFLQVAS